MKIIYSLHALERIRQRNIDKNLVIQCIQNPDKSEEIEGVYKCIKENQ